MNTKNDDIVALMTERELLAQFMASCGYDDESTMRDAVLANLAGSSVVTIANSLLQELEDVERPSYLWQEYVSELGQLASALAVFLKCYESYRMERAVRFGPAGPTPLGYDDGLRYLTNPIAEGQGRAVERHAK